MVADNYAALLARQRAEVTDGLFSAVRRLRWSADRLAAERERQLRELLSWSVGDPRSTPSASATSTPTASLKRTCHHSR